MGSSPMFPLFSLASGNADNSRRIPRRQATFSYRITPTEMM